MFINSSVDVGYRGVFGVAPVFMVLDDGRQKEPGKTRKKPPDDDIFQSLLEEKMEKYAELEKEHFGDPDKKTGIYAERKPDDT